MFGKGKNNKRKKTRITFKTFYKKRSQDYKINNKIYRPKKTYIENSIRFFGLYSQLSKHKTKMGARHKKTLLEQKTNKLENIMRQMGLNAYVNLAKSKIKAINECAPSIEKIYLPGQRIEIDASKEYWGTEEWTLYTAIDSSTKFKVGELIEKEETNIGYLRLLTQVFENYGYPLEIMTDCRRGWDGKNIAQIKDILSHIDVNLYASSNLNAKPKVKRSFRTMKNDFYYEFLRNNDAFTFDKAKKLIIECKDAYNKKYKKELNYKDSLYKKLTSDEWKKLKYHIK